MKTIEFIAPVEAMRGNLSRPKQELKYAEHDNPAWYAPDGVQYARNYQPSFIGAKKASNGRKFFSVKTRSAVNLTDNTRLQMAASGGAFIIWRACQLAPSIYTLVVAGYREAKESGYGGTLNQYATTAIREGLLAKNSTIQITNEYNLDPSLIAEVNNPWVAGGDGSNVTIPYKIISKFVFELCEKVFYLDGKKFPCLGHDDDLTTDWAYILGNSADGYFGLGCFVLNSEDDSTILYQKENVYSDDNETFILKLNNTTVKVTDNVTANAQYTLVAQNAE